MKWLKKLFVVLLVLAGIFGFLYWQNFSIQKEFCDISSTRLPAEFDGFRVAHLSDLHGREFGKNNKKLLRAVAETHPDIICISGDFFDEKTKLSMLEPILAGLADIAPTYFVTGNHEWQWDNLPEILKQMEALGVTVLENEYAVLARGNAQIVVAGVHDPCGPYDQKSPKALVEEIRTEVGQDSYILMLSHRNDQMELWSELDVDLVLSGHCHGGVFRLPLIGGIFGTRRDLFPEYDAGLYVEKDTNLYVSRGLGYSNTRLRLFNRPHLPVLVLHRS